MQEQQIPSVSAAVSRLREVVTPYGIINERFRKTSPVSFGQFCACLDALGDCDWAIHRYLQGLPDDDLGLLYLATYGLLQVLFVQQDAVKYAAVAVGMPYSRPRELTAIRAVRNEAVGHAPENSFGIVQIELRCDRFTRYSFNPSTRRNWQEERFSELIAAQTPHIVAGLEAVAEHLVATFGS